MKLELKAGSFSYDAGRQIFSDISFTAETGRILCLLGPNGAGKSTLLQCLNHMEPLSSGQVLIDEKDIRQYARNELARKIAYVPQTHIPAFPFASLDVVLMGRTACHGFFSAPGEQDLVIARQAMAQLGIAAVEQIPYTELSGGERQLVLLAAALAQEASFLILDEPAAHLDFGNQHRLLELLRQLAKNGKGIIMCTHFPDHVLAIADQAVILKDGSLIARGRADEIINEENIYQAYGIHAVIGSLENYPGHKICRVL